MRASFTANDPKKVSKSRTVHRFFSDLFLQEEEGDVSHSIELFNQCKLFTYSEIDRSNQIVTLRLSVIGDLPSTSWKETYNRWIESDNKMLSKWAEVLKVHSEKYEKNREQKQLQLIFGLSKQEKTKFKEKRKQIFADNIAFGFRIVLSEDSCHATFSYFSFKLLALLDYSTEEYSSQVIRSGAIPNLFAFASDDGKIHKFPPESLEFLLLNMFECSTVHHENTIETKIIIPRTFETQMVRLTNHILPMTWRKEVYLDFYTVIEPLGEAVPLRYKEISFYNNNYAIDFTKGNAGIDYENLFKFLDKYYGRSYPETDKAYESKICRIKPLLPKPGGE